MENLTNPLSQIIKSSQTRDATLVVCLSFLKIIPFRASQIRQRIAKRIEDQTVASKPGDGNDQMSTISMVETEERAMQSHIFELRAVKEHMLPIFHRVAASLAN